MEILEVWMDSNKVSRKELAKQTGISEEVLTSLLNGNRRFSARQIDLISQVTGISASELLGHPEDDFAGYTVMLRGGRKQLTPKQESMIMDVALLANDYERLRKSI